MTGADIPAVAGLEKALFGAEAWSPDILAHELAAASDSTYYLVADDDGVVTGYAGLLIPGGGQADVLTLGVAADRWGQGIGTALLDALLAEADRRRCTDVFLEVRVDNDRAQQLYLRNGFERVGVRRGYYQPSGMDAVVMRRVIQPRPSGLHRLGVLRRARHGDENGAGPAAPVAPPV
jgi:[ribosomal protein S18]-alanine N-acetyltransferase